VELQVEADPRFQWSALRGGSQNGTQRVGLRIDYPDVTAPDFDGDGRKDLCFNLADTVTCYLQGDRGFAGAKVRRFYFDLLSDDERQDTTLRVDSRLVDLSGDGRPDLLLQKSHWDLSDMQTSLFVFRKLPGGGFGGKPAQTITRKGYFAFHELIDFSGHGAPDLVAPVAALGWSDLARIFLAKSADVDFIRYRNLGGHFDAEPQSLHRLSFPVESHNFAAILGALPLWDVHLRSPRVSGRPERQVAFFPGKEAVDLYALDLRPDGSLDFQPLWKTSIPVGSEVLPTELAGNGLNELVFAYPRDGVHAGTLLFLDSLSN
jgi:hypothetical protein